MNRNHGRAIEPNMQVRHSREAAPSKDGYTSGSPSEPLHKDGVMASIESVAVWIDRAREVLERLEVELHPILTPVPPQPGRETPETRASGMCLLHDQLLAHRGNLQELVAKTEEILGRVRL